MLCPHWFRTCGETTVEGARADDSPLGSLNADYSSSAPSIGSSADSTFERRLMLEA